MIKKKKKKKRKTELQRRNNKTNQALRIKANLPKIVTGICPTCEVNLYGKKKLPLPLTDENDLGCVLSFKDCYFKEQA